MRAVVFEDTRKVVYREDYPTPVAAPGEVLIHVKYCGLCGTDLHNYAHKMYQTPIAFSPGKIRNRKKTSEAYILPLVPGDYMYGLWAKGG